MPDSQPSVVKRYCCCCGCGCVLPVLAILLFLAAVVLLPNFWASSRNSMQLHPPPEITREDHWKLQDKISSAKQTSGLATTSLELTLPEFNALLTRFAPKPAAGVVITRMWAYLDETNDLHIILDGSGFRLRNLTIDVGIKTANSMNALKSITVNGSSIPFFIVELLGGKWFSTWLKYAFDPDMHFPTNLSTASGVIIISNLLPEISDQGVGR